LRREEVPILSTIDPSRTLAPWAARRRFFASSGITAGMKVLDVGSGTGDVALLLADLVGPRGAVVGVETNPTILKTARTWVRAAGWTNVTDGASDWPGYAYVDETLRSLLPMLEQTGLANTEEMGADTLVEHVRTEVVGQRGVQMLPIVIGAWARKP